MWSFRECLLTGWWFVENEDEHIVVINRDQAIKLSGILNGYEITLAAHTIGYNV